MYTPDLSAYQLTSIITRCGGGSAVVYSGIFSDNGQKVAIKRFFVDKTKENATLIEKEILTTKELQHPNILPYFTSFVHGHDLYVVSPLMNLGSCRDILNKYYSEGFPEIACAMILKDVLHGVNYLHKQEYIHRGIRASHVLISLDGRVCLSGLRSAASLLDKGRKQKCLHSLPPQSHNNAHLIWLGPEVLEQTVKGYDEKSDIYSIGMLSCELANGSVPFSDIPTTLMFTEKVRGSCPQLLDYSTIPAEQFTQEQEVRVRDCNADSGVGDSVASGSALHIRQVYAQRKLSEPFHHISELCFARDPRNRPSAATLLNHIFFKQIKKSDFLPNILDRVKPIEPQPDEMAAFNIEHQLSEMEVSKCTEWDF